MQDRNGSKVKCNRHKTIFHNPTSLTQKVDLSPKSSKQNKHKDGEANHGLMGGILALNQTKANKKTGSV